ncbi:hypothetical protein PV10_09173 [Exophiala mesophila]|uniref:Inhibitor I9 domain-containing protein n=1 Tax=Exophiala mesophila TaxID=212818 RepID=A0A0D1ZML8_EXOME|nr:uncharacterized protein PV10_09173 [Exophiala mesophila]KIV87993.1 hypothetical protein PV10_09173 [Exophiala mesophila]
MRFYTTILILCALFVAALARPPPLKMVVVSYPKDTPPSIVDKAIEEVRKAGGIVTHQYCKSIRQQLAAVHGLTFHLALIKGFTAKVSDAMIEKINTLSNDKYPAFVEDDSIITISNSS